MLCAVGDCIIAVCFPGAQHTLAGRCLLKQTMGACSQLHWAGGRLLTGGKSLYVYRGGAHSLIRICVQMVSVYVT